MPKTAHTATPHTATLGDDLLWGVQQIAEFLGRDARATFHLLASGQLPGARIGGRWIASRTRLRAHIEALLQGLAA